MNLSPELIKLIIVIFAALAVGGLVVGLMFPYFTGQADVSRRAKKVASGNLNANNKLKSAGKDKTQARSRRIQETLKEFEEAEKKRRKKRLAERLGDVFEEIIDL